MTIDLSGNLKYLGRHIYYHFTDQWGARQRVSLRLKVDRPGRNRNGKDIFPQEAIAIAKTIDRDVRMMLWGLPQPRKKVVLKQLLENYLKNDGNDIRPSTKQLYTSIVEKFNHYKPGIFILQISKELLIDYKKYLLDTVKNSPFTVAKDFRHLAALFNFAVREHFIPENPITRHVRPKLPKKYPVIYTEGELAALFGYLQEHSPSTYQQYLFLYMTGFRVDESCLLKWSQIDWGLKAIRHFNEKGSRDELFPLSDYLFDMLKALPRGGEFVFPERSRYKLYNRVRIAREALKITKPKAVHILKKNYSTVLAMQGTPHLLLPQLTHHSSLGTAKESYVYVELEEKRKWLNLAHEAMAKKLQNSENTFTPADRLQKEKAQ